MPHLSQSRQGWQHHYHLIATAYGQWLRGDPRGWRERHHRFHVPGDYHHPPPRTAYNDALLAQSKSLLNHDPAFFAEPDRPFIGDLFLGTLHFQHAEPIALSVGGEHLHALVRCPLDNPEAIIASSKHFVWNKFHEGQPRPWPKLWAKRPYGKPINGHAHFLEARAYILKHAEEKAWVWQSPPTPPH